MAALAFGKWLDLRRQGEGGSYVGGTWPPEPIGGQHSAVPNQCLVAAFALACARKKRIISRLASGQRASV